MRRIGHVNWQYTNWSHVLTALDFCSWIWPSIKAARGRVGHLDVNASGHSSFRILTQSLLMPITVGWVVCRATPSTVTLLVFFFLEPQQKNGRGFGACRAREVLLLLRVF